MGKAFTHVLSGKKRKQTNDSLNHKEALPAVDYPYFPLFESIISRIEPNFKRQFDFRLLNFAQSKCDGLWRGPPFGPRQRKKRFSGFQGYEKAVGLSAARPRHRRFVSPGFCFVNPLRYYYNSIKTSKNAEFMMNKL